MTEALSSWSKYQQTFSIEFTKRNKTKIGKDFSHSLPVRLQIDTGRRSASLSLRGCSISTHFDPAYPFIAFCFLPPSMLSSFFFQTSLTYTYFDGSSLEANIFAIYIYGITVEHLSSFPFLDFFFFLTSKTCRLVWMLFISIRMFLILRKKKLNSVPEGEEKKTANS